MKRKCNQSILLGIFLMNIILMVSLVESQQAVNLTESTLSAEAKSLLSPENTLSIAGTRYNDSNSNGIMDEGEKGLADTIIRLVLNGTEINKTVTNVNGRYYFSSLNPGEYTVVNEMINGWNHTTPPDGIYKVTLSANSEEHLDFGDTGGIITDGSLTPEQIMEAQRIYRNLPKTSMPITDTGFAYPTGLPPTKDRAYGYADAHTYYEYAGWLARSDEDHYGSHDADRYHIGQDIPAVEGTAVYPITDGEIVYVSTNGWGTGNIALIVKHRVKNDNDNGNSEEFLALYGHIRPNSDLVLPSTSGPVNPPIKLCSRVQFATVGPWEQVPHLHFGIHPGLDIPSQMGFLQISTQWPNKNDLPTTNGFVDPIAWMTTHTPFYGPDRFGYTFTDNTLNEDTFINDRNSCAPVFEWIEISGDGTEILPSSDDQYVSNILLGPNFFFNFYGMDYSQVAISNNGLAFSGAGSSQFTNQPIKQSSSVHGFIAPFWDDIVTWGSADSIYYKTIEATSTEPRKFVVEWKDNQHYSSSPEGITFQIILEEGSNNIKFQYLDTTFGTSAYDNGGSATVGIESPIGDDGLQYSYNKQMIKPGLAILYRFPQTEGTNLYLSKQAPASKDRGSTMIYTMHYHNFGDTVAQNVVLSDTLPSEVNFISSSDGGSYDSSTRKITWNLNSVEAGGHDLRTVTVSIPESVAVGTLIQNDASISTSNLEVRYDDNEASAQTRITGTNLPPNVNVEPNLGGTTPSVYWGTPVTFSYYHPTATDVEINIHLNDGGPDIIGSMTHDTTGHNFGSDGDWTYTTTFHPRHGLATVTYNAQGVSCQAAATAPDGLHIYPSSGLIGLEQHLYNSEPGDGYVPPSGSFPSAGLLGSGGYSTYVLDNGYAGKGAFAPHPSALSEKYYINMRWPDGITWNEDGTHTFTDLSTYSKYAHKKVLITSPVTGKGVVASIEESGPAIWTGKDAGAPPEVFVALGLYPRGDGQNERSTYTLNFQWADQSAQLGPCSSATSFNIYIDPAGYVYNTNTNERIEGATVWLQRPDGAGGWENVPTGQVPPIMQPDENPLVTGVDGQYQWDVLEGSYRVHVEAPGYNPTDSIVVSIPPPVTDLHIGLTPLEGINTPPDTPSIPAGQTSGLTGTSYDYTTSARDRDGDQVQITIDWGDGTTLTSDPVDSEAIATLSHIWSTAGTYQVKAMATDSNGASSDWSEALMVTTNTLPNMPSVPTGPVSGYAWAPYSYQTSATDPDGDQVQLTIDWGDGTNSTSELINSATSASLTHTWTAAGTYQIKAMSTDSKGATSPWSASLAVTIAPNKRPNAPSKLIGPTSGYVGASYPFLTAATDPNGDRVKYTYDWGDGTTYTTPLVNSGITASISHKWTTAGTYRVRTMATDSKGAPSAWSKILTVKIANRYGATDEISAADETNAMNEISAENELDPISSTEEKIEAARERIDEARNAIRSARDRGENL